jgi:hypothetical protein
LAQVLLPVDLSHHVSVVVHQHGLKSRLVPEDLHDDVVSSDLMVCVAHLKMDGAHQNELVAPLALNFVRDVKDGMGVDFYLPSFFSFTLFNFALYFNINSREQIKKGRSLKRPFL